MHARATHHRQHTVCHMTRMPRCLLTQEAHTSAPAPTRLAHCSKHVSCTGKVSKIQHNAQNHLAVVCTSKLAATNKVHTCCVPAQRDIARHCETLSCTSLAFATARATQQFCVCFACICTCSSTAYARVDLECVVNKVHERQVPSYDACCCAFLDDSMPVAVCRLPLGLLLFGIPSPRHCATT